MGELVDTERPITAPAVPGGWVALCGFLLRPDADLAQVSDAIDIGADLLGWWAPDVATGGFRPCEPAEEHPMQVAVRTRPRPEASWRPLLRSLGAPLGGPSDARNESVVVAVRVRGPDGSPRRVLWCFGAVSRAVPAGLVDPRFGLVVALNKHAEGQSSRSWRDLPADVRQRRLLGDPRGRVRAFESDVTAGPRSRASVRSAGPASVSALRFDIAADLLRGLTIRTHDDLMLEIKGGRAVQFTTYVDSLDDFARLAEHLVDAHSRLDYSTTGWDWVDHVVPVPTRAEEDQVLHLLHRRVREGPQPAADVLLTETFGLDDPDAQVSFRMPYERSAAPARLEVAWTDVRRWLAEREVPPADAQPMLRRAVRVYADGTEATRVPLSDLLVAEVSDDDSDYVLSDGSVLLVQRDFLARVNAFIDAIDRTDALFPAYDGGTEPRYLQEVPALSDDAYAVLDGLEIRLPGETEFEVCDLVSAEPRLVFAKIKGRSSLFSHLCTQAETAAELLKRSAEARAQLVDRVARAGARPEVRRGVDRAVAELAAGHAGGVTITLLLLGSWRDRGLRSLPLVSRVRLRQCAQKVVGLGYRFEVARP